MLGPERILAVPRMTYIFFYVSSEFLFPLRSFLILTYTCILLQGAVIKAFLTSSSIKAHQVFLCLLTFSTSFRTACTVNLPLLNSYRLSDRNAFPSSSFFSLALFKCPYSLILVSVRYMRQKVVTSTEAFFGISSAILSFSAFPISLLSILSITLGIVSTADIIIDLARTSSGPGVLPDFNLSPALSSLYVANGSGGEGIVCLSHLFALFEKKVFSLYFLILLPGTLYQ